MGHDLAENLDSSRRLLGVAFIVEIFYGLAIASGIEHVAEEAFSGRVGDWPRFLAPAVSAFFVGVGDFLVYFHLISKFEYRSAYRLLLDLVVLVSVFFLFESVQHATAFISILCAYFAFGSLYYLLLRTEHRLGPTTWTVFYLQIVLFVTCVLLLAAYLTFGGVIRLVTMYAVCGLAICWGVYNLRVAHAEIVGTSRSPAPAP